MTYIVILLFSTVVWLAKGHYDPSIPLLVIAFLVWVYSKLFLKPIFKIAHAQKIESYFYQGLPWLSAVMMAIKPNLIYVLESFRPIYLYFRFIPLGVVALSTRKSKTLEWCVAFGILVFFLAALYLSPIPFIDVFRSNNAAVDFFLQGLNPYSQTYADIYGGRFDYHTGFLYWPMTLYLQTFSKLFFHDIRVILVIAWWGGAFFFPKTNPRVQELKKIWWLIPFLAFGFEQAWLDPILSAGAAITLWAMWSQKWVLMALTIAVAASMKQYGIIIGIFPVFLMFLEQKWKPMLKVMGIGGLVFALALAPFLFWNFQDFLSMTITAHASALPRADALNFTAFWMKTTGLVFPGLSNPDVESFIKSAQLAMTALGFILAFYHVIKNRAQRSLAVIPEAWAISFGFSMLFGKFAFCNYHWLLISFWILSLAFEDADRARS